ncbi:hypothetical protein, partial [Rahnella sp. ChDrAdgB13]|uniref:hypothetical protein n=1 Tax=Rahnella sp. ChDrAdgB13 TaxID=1850581 RepID=UPI001AD87C10
QKLPHSAQKHHASQHPEHSHNPAVHPFGPLSRACGFLLGYRSRHWLISHFRHVRDFFRSKSGTRFFPVFMKIINNQMIK